jgi:hypothetical protein
MIVNLELESCSADLDKVFHYARGLDLDPKRSHEVCEGWDMIQIWRDRIEERFGMLQSWRHRSDGDDPPDFDLVFPDRVVAFEHTRLQPYPLGWAEDVKQSELSDSYTAMPALSNPPKDREELLHTMTSVLDAPWANVVDEWDAIGKALADTLRRKMCRLPQGGIIGIIDHTSWWEHSLTFLFETAEQFINSPKLVGFEPYLLIILSRLNPKQYHSALIARGRKIECRC